MIREYFNYKGNGGTFGIFPSKWSGISVIILMKHGIIAWDVVQPNNNIIRPKGTRGKWFGYWDMRRIGEHKTPIPYRAVIGNSPRIIREILVK